MRHKQKEWWGKVILECISNSFSLTVESKRRNLRYIPEVEWHLVTKYEGRKLRMTQSILA